MKKKKNNVILITSSPRKKSNSKTAGKFLAGNLFSKYEYVDINKYDIKSCSGCDKCKNSLICVKKDDAEKIIKKIENSEFVIVASPVYFTGVPSKLKCFIDRNQVQWYKNKNRKEKNKKGIIILTADLKDKKNFLAAESEIKSFFAVNKIKCISSVKLSGVINKNYGVLKKEIKKIRSKIGK